MQAPQPKPSVGVIYNTSMSRPDAALALAALYGFRGRGESRMGCVCVTGSGLNAAIFCDIVGRFYMPGPQRNANEVLPVGLAAENPLPPNPPMVQPVVEHDPPYPHSIRKLTDTSLAEAVLRNGVTFNAESVVILSAPATYLSKSLDLLGVKDLYKERVKRLVIVDSGAPQQDVPALRKILAEWPSPIYFCGKEVGEALPFPGAGIEQNFTWTTTHPVVDAYRAFQRMPYDAPSYDLAAAHYAVHSDSGLFQLAGPGSVSVGNDGLPRFIPGAGRVNSLTVDAGKRDQILRAFIEICSAKPPAPPQRGRGKQ